jgi:AraC family transcriptional regulator
MTRTTLAALALACTASLTFAAPQAPKAKASPAPPVAAATPAAAAPAASPAVATAPAAPAPAVVVKTVEPIHALVVSMKGSYMQHGDAFTQLMSQLATQGKNPIGPPFGRYFNSMGDVSETDLQWEIGFPVGPEVKATAPLELKDIPGGLVATLVYDGPSDGISVAVPGVGRWVAENGYRATGPMSIVFVGQPDPMQMRVELRLPVEKLK